MLAILSDIHANLPALEAVLEDARTHDCKHFLSLGDVVGYGAYPGECINLLQSIHAVNILGNHDSYIVFKENCPRSRVVSQIINYQRNLLNTEQVRWLKGSKSSLREDNTLFVHGGPDDPKDQYLYIVSKDLIPQDVRWLFSGHTHVQFLADFVGRGYCNPGSVGQPRDGDCRAAYVIKDGNSIMLRRVRYDIDRIVTAMQKAGFDPFCYENLYNGTQIGGRIDHIKAIH